MQLHPQLSKAHTLPARIYHDHELYQRERERIFWGSWQVVGLAQDLERPGDFFTAEVAGEPLVVNRGVDGVVRAFYNVCRHRAGAVAVGKGNRKVLQCRYHGWTYGLDGKLLKTREFDGVEDFDPDCFGRHRVAVEVWGPMVLVNLQNEAPPLATLLGEIVSETSHLKLDGLRLVERRDYEIACNWKVYVENYLEGYHIPMAHPGLYREIDYAGYRVETRRFHSLQLAPLRPPKSDGHRYAQLEPDTEVLYYWVWPNLMLNFYPDNFSMNLVLPLGTNRTLTRFEWYYG
jgi:choline monooxygenase